MNYEVVQLPTIQVVGLSVKADNSDEGVLVIGNTWQKFIEENVITSIKNISTGFGIGLYTEYESDATGSYTFMCGCEVSNNENPELNSITIESGSYAKFTIKGHRVHDVMKAWQEIWNMQLNRKFSYDFEVYHNDSEDMNNQTIDIFIALN